MVLILGVLAAFAQTKPQAAKVRVAQSAPAKSRAAEPPAAAQAAAPPRVSRGALEAMERAMDRKFETTMDEDPFSLLGATRGVYLDGYGVVFTTEVDLAPSAAPNPFRPAYGRGELMLLKEKKKYRIQQLKESMRAMLYECASTLDTLRTDENITIAVTVPYFRWENSEGMPRQIVLTATRKTALDAKAGSPAAIAAVKVQELL